MTNIASDDWEPQPDPPTLLWHASCQDWSHLGSLLTMLDTAGVRHAPYPKPMEKFPDEYYGSTVAVVYMPHLELQNPALRSLMHTFMGFAVAPTLHIHPTGLYCFKHDGHTEAQLEPEWVGLPRTADDARIVFETILRILFRVIRVAGTLSIEPTTVVAATRDRLNSLLEAVKRSPDVLHSISPRLFEEFVASLLVRDGLDVTLNKPTRDGGIDILARDSNGIVFAYECKRFRPDRPIDVGIVRAFGFVTHHSKAAAGVLCTTSRFTLDAIEAAELSRVVIPYDLNTIHRWSGGL